MRVGDVMEGCLLLTRLTDRTGIVQSHDKDGGVKVLWKDGRVTQVHPNVEVDVVEGVFERRES